MSFEDLVVPVGAHVVHIGFNKTGTTSVQGAVSRARDDLAEHGLIYPGAGRYQKMAGIAITGAHGRLGDRPATMKDWRRLVAQVERAEKNRVLVSSEWLCEATEEQVRTVVEDLGGDRVHVVATLRPLTSILPSSWQQYLQNGSRMQYEDWLRGMLLEPPFQSRHTKSFWRRHQHDVVLARWASVAGPENVTAIVVDSTDRNLLLRQFEGLLGVPEGILTPEPEEWENRSLTWPEAEMLRRVNVAFRKREWPDALYRSAVRLGLVARLAAARPTVDDMPKLVMPQWALEKASEIGAGMAATIGELGIRVVGDLESIGRLPTSGGGTNPRPQLSAAFVANVVAGLIDDRYAAEQAVRDRPQPPTPVSPVSKPATPGGKAAARTTGKPAAQKTGKAAGTPAGKVTGTPGPSSGKPSGKSALVSIRSWGRRGVRRVARRSRGEIRRAVSRLQAR